MPTGSFSFLTVVIGIRIITTLMVRNTFFDPDALKSIQMAIYRCILLHEVEFIGFTSGFSFRCAKKKLKENFIKNSRNLRKNSRIFKKNSRKSEKTHFPVNHNFVLLLFTHISV